MRLPSTSLQGRLLKPRDLSKQIKNRYFRQLGIYRRASPWLDSRGGCPYVGSAAEKRSCAGRLLSRERTPAAKANVNVAGLAAPFGALRLLRASSRTEDRALPYLVIWGDPRPLVCKRHIQPSRENQIIFLFPRGRIAHVDIAELVLPSQPLADLGHGAEIKRAAILAGLTQVGIEI